MLRRVARAALEPMADIAVAKAPHRTGRLAYSIAVSEVRTSRAKWQAGGFRSARATGITMAMGPASGLGTLQYASFDEFGTVDTPTFAYMRAAWDADAMPALERIKVSLSVEVLKAAAKYNRKLAKKAAA